MVWLFFFQAEDGIRDGRVTGVQTCALPILRHQRHSREHEQQVAHVTKVRLESVLTQGPGQAIPQTARAQGYCFQIGRASCRERVETSVVAVSSNTKAVYLAVYDRGSLRPST